MHGMRPVTTTPSSSSTCIFLGLFVCSGTSHVTLIAIPLSLGDLLQGSEWLSNLYYLNCNITCLRAGLQWLLASLIVIDD